MRRLAAAAAAWAAGAVPAAACRLALVLAVDVSGSVDDREYGLQLSGIVAAFRDPEVQAALFAFPEAPVAVTVFEWSASAYQRQLQDWILLSGPAEVEVMAAALLSAGRGAAPEATGLGAALRAGVARFAAAPACWRQVIDVSGDGKNNDWPAPEAVRRSGALAGVTVNALVVGQDNAIMGDERQAQIGDLVAYFQAEVIHGPDAFVQAALGYEDYAAAMTRKLLREISAPPLGARDAPVRFAAR